LYKDKDDGYERVVD